MESYSQDIKKQAREKLIDHAINSLTNQRQGSFLVSKDHFTKITDHFNSLLFRALGAKDFEFINQYNWQFFGGKNSWFEFYENSCRPKKACELKVLYLSGPEPYNDIDILCSKGIRVENIWAIESDKKTYEQAVNSLKEAKIQIKIHRGSLSEFFEFTNHEFDIIYFDACSPILSPKQSPLDTLKQIFLNRRLTGLSVLITNFAEPKENYNWGDALAPWFAPKEFGELPEIDDDFGGSALEKCASFPAYSHFINQHLDTYYSSFLTHFIPVMASEIIPMWQLSTLGSVQSNHLLNEQALQKELKTIKNQQFTAKNFEELLSEVPHYALAADVYPLLNWARLIRENLSADHALIKFIDSNRNKMTIENALYICSLLKRFEEANTGFKTFIHNICGQQLKTTLDQLDFFDRNMRITCDIPMKNLLVELLIGLYGHPYIAHAGKNLSLKYKAKETWMYSDVFVFDQCRYLYDFLPSVDLWASFFENKANQTIMRGCIDEIRRNHLDLNSSLFKWGFIECMNDEFSSADLAERINLNESSANKVAGE